MATASDSALDRLEAATLYAEARGYNESLQGDVALVRAVVEAAERLQATAYWAFIGWEPDETTRLKIDAAAEALASALVALGRSPNEPSSATGGLSATQKPAPCVPADRNGKET